jgi:chloramphenicol O-acetyltransferase type A
MVRMVKPVAIDVDSWARREHFEHFLRAVPCTYSITAELDATAFVDAVRRAGRKTYVAQIWALAAVVNRHDEFRMCLTDDGRPAVWPVVHPSFTVFNPDAETFASVWAPFDPDFATFHAAAARVLAEQRGATAFFPQSTQPPNTFDVSSLPWVSFTGFTLNIRNAWEHLAPIVTLGRYVDRGGRPHLPVALQVHHAAADGFHTSRLLTELQELLAEPDWLD